MIDYIGLFRYLPEILIATVVLAVAAGIEYLLKRPSRNQKKERDDDE